MNLRLIFNAKQHVRSVSVLHHRDGFQNIPVFLNRNRLIIFSVRQYNGGCIDRFQLLRFNNLLSVVKQKIKRIRENRAILHIFFCDSIFISHRNHFPSCFIISLFSRAVKSVETMFLYQISNVYYNHVEPRVVGRNPLKEHKGA